MNGINIVLTSFHFNVGDRNSMNNYIDKYFVTVVLSDKR